MSGFSSQAGIQLWIGAPPVPFDREVFDPELSALIVATAAARRTAMPKVKG